LGSGKGCDARYSIACDSLAALISYMGGSLKSFL